MSPVIKGPAFHQYADARSLLGIPHTGDVLSNLPFALVGVFGLLLLSRVTALPRVIVGGFFASVLAIGLGSGAYHAAPGDATLALDWLPIVLSLAFLVSLLIADRIDRRAGLFAAVVLPLAAAGSVLHWWLGGGTSGGDMRWYGFLQVLFIVTVPLILVLYPRSARRGVLDGRFLMLALGSFIAARLVNRFDATILDVVGLSGHTLKHLAAGLATFFVYRAVRGAAVAADAAAAEVDEPLSLAA